METIEQKKLKPSFGSSFDNGWQVMKKYFLILFLVVLVLIIINGPTQAFRWNINSSHHFMCNFPHYDLNLIALLIMAGVFALFALAYAFLIIPVFNYGGKLMFVQAVRDERPDFNTLIKGFRENYLAIILANLLTFALVMLGFIALIIPGIIIACRLAFVGYLVMDKKLDAIQAVEESWKMTKGHGWTIFSMAIVSFFICIGGLCLIIVGIFPALMWISSSFACLYEAIIIEKQL
jgi:hypothetical protein